MKRKHTNKRTKNEKIVFEWQLTPFFGMKLWQEYFRRKMKRCSECKQKNWSWLDDFFFQG